jgi:hypothetical protein
VGRSRGRYATPADFPRHDGTSYRGLRVRRWGLGFVHRSRTILCRAVPNLRVDSQLLHRCIARLGGSRWLGWLCLAGALTHARATRRWSGNSGTRPAWWTCSSARPAASSRTSAAPRGSRFSTSPTWYVRSLPLKREKVEPGDPGGGKGPRLQTTPDCVRHAQNPHTHTNTYARTLTNQHGSHWQHRRNDATELAHADMTALPKTDTKYTALSLIPTIIGNTFAASLRTDTCPQRKESSSTSQARNPFNLNFFDSASV